MKITQIFCWKCTFMSYVMRPQKHIQAHKHTRILNRIKKGHFWKCSLNYPITHFTKRCINVELNGTVLSHKQCHKNSDWEGCSLSPSYLSAMPWHSLDLASPHFFHPPTYISKMMGTLSPCHSLSLFSFQLVWVDTWQPHVSFLWFHVTRKEEFKCNQ